MSGNRLVVHERAEPELRHPIGPQRHLEDRGSRSVERRRRVRRGRVRLAESRIRLCDDRPFRAHVELKRRPALGLADHRVDVGHDLLPAVFGQRIAQILLQLRDAILHRAGRSAELAQNGVHVALELGHLAKADLVDLIGREIGRREVLQEICIGRGASFEAPQARALGRSRHERFQIRDRLLPFRVDALADDALGLRRRRPRDRPARAL